MKNKTRKAPYPVLIEQKGKHYTSRYLAKNASEKLSIGLEILKDWKTSSYLEKDTTVAKTFNDYVKKETNMTVKEIEELTKGAMAKVPVQLQKYGQPAPAAEQLKSLQNSYEQETEYNQVVELANQAIKKKDGKIAWEVIDYFRGGEYMEVETLTFDNVEYDT